MRAATATKMDATLIALLGGQHFEGVAFTTDQVKALRAFYGFDPSLDAAGAKEAVARAQEAREAWNTLSPQEQRKRAEPKVPDEKVVATFLRSGSTRNMFRHVQHDGLRIMAFLSKFLEKGEDPVHFVQGLCIDAGFDCGAIEGDETDQ